MRFALPSVSLFFAFVSFGLFGCATATEVSGPEGVRSHAISCNFDKSNCWEKAAEICPDGYVLHASEGGAVVWSTPSFDVAGGVSSVNSRYEGSVLITCKADIPGDPAQAEREAREDVRTCEAAQRHSVDLGTYWREWRAKTVDAPALDEAPDKDAFLDVCRSLSSSLQRCMHAKYRAAHAKACRSLFSTMPARKRADIDALFFQIEDPTDGA